MYPTTYFLLYYPSILFLPGIISYSFLLNVFLYLFNSLEGILLANTEIYHNITYINVVIFMIFKHPPLI